MVREVTLSQERTSEILNKRSHQDVGGKEDALLGPSEQMNTG